jgi:hypothetical protein
MKIKRYGNYDLNSLTDLIVAFSANIEDAYIEAGVTDYTAKECVDHAIKALTPTWRNTKFGKEIDISYPAKD